MQVAAGQRGQVDAAKDAKVHAQVHIGQPDGSEGFGLEVHVQVEGVEDQGLIDAAHKVRGSRSFIGPVVAHLGGTDMSVQQGTGGWCGSEGIQSFGNG
jgi:hypothetical protein